MSNLRKNSRGFLKHCNSDSEEEDVDSEEEDFREDTKDPQEPCDASASSLQLYIYSSQTSDSSEEENLAVDEDEPQFSNEDKLVVVNAPPKLFSKDRFKWIGQKGKLYRTPKKI
ncbi:hypothetical protein FQA39_LY07707 [Lamprigera yunnana]|nr:hypothetical protein FQA39_LY07707 [Lamprigera yunnana]